MNAENLKQSTVEINNLIALQKSLQTRLKSLYPRVDGESTLPWCWNPKERFNFIGLSNAGLRMQYKTHAGANNEGATVRSNTTIPPASGVYYFEVKIVCKGKEGHIAIGLTTSFGSQVGLLGMDKHSYGYHGGEGTIYNAKVCSQYGPLFTTGDVIGCGVNFADNTCFYTKNGHNLGVAFKELPNSLYPAVGLHAVGGVIDANFGQFPFLYDVEELTKEMKSKAKTIIDNYSLSIVDNQDTMRRLILTYLLHNGYCATAQTFASDSNQELHYNLESIQNRRDVMKLVAAGKIHEAIELTQQYYPGLLDNQPLLLFRLKCRQFIEMINSNHTTTVQCNGTNGNSSDTEYMDMDDYIECNGFSQNSTQKKFSLEKILEFGKELYNMSQHLLCGSDKTNKTMLKNAFSLLAYSNPHNSPLGWQLQTSQRDAISDELNSAILKINREPAKAPLELALAHAQNLLSVMSKSGIGLASFIDIKDFV